MTSDATISRKRLFKYTIENYRVYLDEFEKNPSLDTAGAITNPSGYVYYNFFWARSSYIKKYMNKPEVSDNRYIWEVYIGSEFSNKKKDIVTFSPILRYNSVTTHPEVHHIHDHIMI